MTEQFGSAATWLVLGVALMLAELVLPGLISIFLGAAACLVAGMLALGILQSQVAALIAWLLIAIALVLALRSTLMRFFPGDTSKGSLDEDAQAAGSIVVAASDLSADHDNGQIAFRETLWLARTVCGTVKKGANARLIRREGLVWIVEPVEPDKI